jgi:N utilization substance protein B
MALPKEKFREIVFQLLYSSDFAGEEEAVSSLLMQEHKTTRSNLRLAKERAGKVADRTLVLDEKIGGASTAYSFERISGVERNILRLGVFELLFDPEIPPKVAIAEAIRLCRKFGTKESAKYVNAVMDAVFSNGSAPV